MNVKSVAKIPTSARVRFDHTEGVSEACLVAHAQIAANVQSLPFGATVARMDDFSTDETFQTACVTMWTD